MNEKKNIQKEAIIRADKKRKEELKRKRDNIEYKKMDDRMNKAFVKTVERGANLGMLLGDSSSVAKKMIIEDKKDRKRLKTKGSKGIFQDIVR